MTSFHAEKCCHLVSAHAASARTCAAASAIYRSIVICSLFVYILSNVLHSSIGQNIKSHAVSSLRSPMSVLRPECEKLQMVITQQRVIPIYFVFGARVGFSGRRIEGRHFRLDQIQDGGQWPFWKKTSDGHISVTRHPIYFVFGSRLGFLARNPRIALFNLTAHYSYMKFNDRPTS